MNSNDQNLGKLSIEQQFKLAVLKKEIESMPLEQTKEYLLEAFRQMMVKDNLCRDLFKKCYL